MFETWPLEKRIDEARTITKRLVDHVHYLLDLHENNAIAIYSDTLAKQIKTSDAAAAFHIFQTAMHQFEIVRLCALWDAAKPDRESIPIVIELIDREDIIQALADELRAHHTNQPPAIIYQDGETEEVRKLIDEAVGRNNAEFGGEQAERAVRALREAIAIARDLQSSDLLVSIRNHRDKYLAHSLRATNREKRFGPVEPMKYGNERTVLEKSLPIVEALYCWVNGVSISLSDSRESDRKNAKALWETCTFKTDLPALSEAGSESNEIAVI
jgi:hypothetical protein